MSYSPAEAAQALEAVQASRAKLLETATCPPSRHAAFAVLMAGLVACPAAGNYMILAEAPLMVGVVLVMMWDRRRTGMFVNGYRAGKTRWVTFPLLAVMLSLYGLSFWLVQVRDINWAPYALAALAFPIGFFGSLYWSRVWKRELEGQA